MAITGTWNLTLKTPMGDRPVTVKLNNEGNDLSGTFESPQGSQSFEGGTASGDEAAWSTMFNGAMGEMKLDFVGAVEGDTIDGTVQFGAFGPGTFSGTRA
ncbi:MAG: hypothetical protein O3A10_06265 [Chloroflexi bacterium]|nr:hypothetical protein [Chloroflexota bacterium]MDA1145608.1 hypothetical protein [Chloroflexota bacterium]